MKSHCLRTKISRLLTFSSTIVLASCNGVADFSSPQPKSYEATKKYKNEFFASEVVESKREITEGGRYSEETVTMKDLSPTSTTFKQVDRPARTFSKKQGKDATVSKQDFAVSSAGVLDLVVVIDTSKSMVEERQQLSTRLEPLISAVKDTDWRVAVVSTADPCVVYGSVLGLRRENVVTKQDANPAVKFRDIVNSMSNDDNALERGFPHAIQALGSQCLGTTKWTRDGSAVGVLIVSDEDNCSANDGNQERNCANVYGKTSAEMLRFLSSFRAGSKPGSTSARVYGLVKESANMCPQAAGVGRVYMEAITATGGVTGSICAPNYTDPLTQISKNVERIIKKEFKLDAVPDMNQFSVEADGVSVADPSAWTIQNDTVTINQEFFKDAKKVTFTYSHGAVPRWSDISLGSSVATGTLSIRFGTNPVPASAYSYDAAMSKVTFSPAPADDVLVSLDWKENVALKTEFGLNVSDLREDTLQVRVDNVLAPASSYHFNGSGLIFKSPPKDNANIVASYKTVRHKVVDYEVQGLANAVSVITKDKSSGVEIPSKNKSKSVEFSHTDVVDGRVVTVVFDYGAKPSEFVMSIPNEIVPGSEIKVLIDGESGRCEAQPEDEGPGDAEETTGLTLEVIEAKGSKIKIKCIDGQKDRSKVTVVYKYETERKIEFKVDESIPLGEEPTPTGFLVFIDGKETKKFVRDGHVFTLDPSVLGVASKVEIEATSWRKIDP